MFMPRSMASSRMLRSWTDSRPLAGAMPKMNQSGTPAGLVEGVGEVAADRDAVGYAVEDRAGVEAGVGAVDDREDLVPLGVADEAVGGLAVAGPEVGLAVDDGGGRWSTDAWAGTGRRSGDMALLEMSSEEATDARGPD